MSQNRSQLRVFAVAAVALFCIAGSALADPGNSRIVKHAKPVAIGDDDAKHPPGDSPQPLSSVTLAAPSNDTCTSPTELPLNRTVKVDTTGANDDYQTPATAACFQGLGQTPTTSPGKDVVFSFTAPAAGSYTFSIVHQDPASANLLDANEVLYVSDSCPGSGTVNCIKGANRPLERALVPDLTGITNNQSEQVTCVPMSSGQTYYVFFDAVVPTVTGAGAAIEVRNCVQEAEPNNTPATANAMACGISGSSDVAPTAHCHLGFRGGSDANGILNDGAVCTRSVPLDQSLPESNTRCTISGNPCSWDTATGIDTCPSGEGHCQQLADLDCDPHCTGGPNDGLVCTSNGFCNPGSAQNSTCSGQCLYDATCVVNATGLDTGIQCTPLCVGGTFNGRSCASGATAELLVTRLAAQLVSDCTGGGGVCTNNAGCASGQTCSRQYNEGDADFFSLGTVPAGGKVFTGLDAKAANDYDWRMRVTTTTSTLQFDDDDGVSRNGSGAPEIAGAPGVGTDTFVEVSRTSPRVSEPYLLYSIVQGVYPAQAQLEDESGPVGNDIYFGWPGDVLSANYVNNTVGGNNGYIRGLFNGTHGGFAFDSDCFKFLVHEGDLMSWYGDGEPARSAASNAQFPQPIIYDAEPAGISNFIFGANARKNTLTANATLNGTTPAVTSTFFQWRAEYTGMLEVCYYDASVALGLGTPGNGAWAGSLDVNCGPLPPAGPDTTTTDVSVETTIDSGDGTTGGILKYHIAVTNSSSDIAQEIHLNDVLDGNLSFVALELFQPLNNTTCITSDGFQFLNGLPTPGTADTPIDCITTSLAPGESVTYLLSVQVNNCIGTGIDIPNTATITTVSTDPDPSNDSSTVTVTTTDDGTCHLLACDASSCVIDLCQSAGTCNAGACETVPVDCDDHSQCTDDLCDPSVGCIHDSTNNGDLCDDFNDCTTNACDPFTGCVFPPVPAGTACDDGLTCTSADHCDGGTACVGTNACDDGNPCTDDFADESNACACTYAPSFPGTPCDDGDPCTGTAASPDGCDGANACAGGAPKDCDDGDACTSDSCDPATGCIHTPISCNDGNLCNGTETCSPAIGCVAGTPLACNDGNPCNGIETCIAAIGCVAGTPLACNDGNVCNGTETCSPATGCVAGTPLVCNDGNVCNGTETCSPATGCVAGTPVVCTALDQCHTAGTCTPATGVCSNPNKADGTGCNDANGCTTNDACTNGVCVGGAPPICDDGNICTADACTSPTGCTIRTIDLDVSGFSADRVDGRDLVVLADAYGSCPGNPSYNAAANLDQGTSAPANCVDMADFHLFMTSFGQTCPEGVRQ